MTFSKTFLLVIAASSLFACSHVNDAEREQEEQAGRDQQAAARTAPQARRATAPLRKPPAAASPETQREEGQKPKAADNTGINERDRSDTALTPMDQSNSPEDLRITADIRKAMMKDDSLSFTAKNAKVITRGGHVLLRGPVKTATEKVRIDALARAAAGVLEVDDQLEVESPKD